MQNPTIKRTQKAANRDRHLGAPVGWKALARPVQRSENGGHNSWSFFAAGSTSMTADLQQDVTTLLNELRAGSPDARGRLVARLYDELRRLVGGLMRR
jgi:hypothetical protein